MASARLIWPFWPFGLLAFLAFVAFFGLFGFWALSTNVDVVDLQIKLDNLQQPLNSLCWPFCWPYSQPLINVTTNLAADPGSVLALFREETNNASTPWYSTELKALESYKHSSVI